MSSGVAARDNAPLLAELGVLSHPAPPRAFSPSLRPGLGQTLQGMPGAPGAPRSQSTPATVGTSALFSQSRASLAKDCSFASYFNNDVHQMVVLLVLKNNSTDLLHRAP